MKVFGFLVFKKSSYLLRLFFISTVSIFLFFTSVSDSFSTGSPDFLPDGDHPRIILNSSELSRLVLKRSTNASEWISLQTWCDTHINDAGYNVQPDALSGSTIKYGLANWDGNNKYFGYRMSGFAQHLYSYSLAYQILKQPGSGQDLVKAASYAARVRTLLVDGIAKSLNVGEEQNGLRAIRVSDLSDASINPDEVIALKTSSESLPGQASNIGYKLGYPTRFLMSVPIAYDWVYDTLSQGDKDILAPMMLRWYDWTQGVRSIYNDGTSISGVRYYEDNDAPADSTHINPKTGNLTKANDFSLIYTNFGAGHEAMMALIPVALYGYNADIPTYYAQTRTRMNSTIEQLENDLKQSGGESTEGWNYGSSYNRLLTGIYGYYTATGDTSIPVMTWPESLVKSMVHRLAPNLLDVPFYGYWTGTPMGVNRISFALPFVSILQRLNPTSDTAKVGQYVLNNAGWLDNPSEFENMLFPIPNSAVLPPSSLLLSNHVKGGGIFTSRSSWTDSNSVNVMAHLRGIGAESSHEGYSQGHFTISRGTDRLLSHSNSAGDAPPAVSFNTILFNNTGHHANNYPLTTPAIDRVEEGTSYSYVSGNITNAYKRLYKVDTALFFRRSMLHLRPGVVVVYDVTRSNSAVGNLKDWYTQYTSNPATSTDTISALTGSSQVFVKTLLPSGGTYTTTNPYTGSYRVKYTPAVTQEYDQFLHVIEATSSTASQTPTEKVLSVEGKMIGTYIKDATNPNVVMFSTDKDGLDVTVDVTYTLSAPTAGKSPWHTIVNLPINTDYTVIRPINATVAQTYQLKMGSFPAQGAVYTTSSQGVLRLAPDISIQTPVDGATIAGKKKVSLIVPDNYIVTGMEILVDGTKVAPTPLFTAPNIVELNTLPLGDGTHTIAVVASDADGATSQSNTINVTVERDVSAPTVVITDPVAGEVVFLSKTVNLSATDNYDVATVGFYVDSVLKGVIGTAPFTISWDTTTYSEGNHTLSANATDSTGNIGNAAPVTVNVNNDAILPVVTAFTLPANATSLSVAISSFTATDNVSVTGYLLTETNSKPAKSAAGWTSTAPATYLFSSSGSKTLYAWAKDFVGNVSDSTVLSVAQVSIETTPPTVDTFTAPATSTGLTVSGISFTASDNIAATGYLITESATLPAASAVNLATAPTIYTAATQGAKTLYAWARDAAGNVSLSKSAAVSIDTSLPIVNTFTAPATSTGLTVTGISFTASDNIAVTGYLVTESATTPAASAVNLASAPTSYTFSTQGAKTLYAWARDAAGNVSLSKSAAVTIDLTPPTLTLSPVTTPTILTSQVLAGTVTDNSSAVSVSVKVGSAAAVAASVSGTNWSYTASFGSGAKNIDITVTASDAAGNQTVKTAVIKKLLAGDIDGNGIVELNDALSAMKSGVGKSSFTGDDKIRGDVGPVINGISVPNGTVDTGDAIVILGILVGFYSF